MALFQWIAVSVVLAMTCLVAMIAICILKRRTTLQSADESENSTEMKVNPEHKGHVERHYSSSQGSRSEGEKAAEGNDKISVMNTEQHADV